MAWREGSKRRLEVAEATGGGAGGGGRCSGVGGKQSQAAVGTPIDEVNEEEDGELKGDREQKQKPTYGVVVVALVRNDTPRRRPQHGVVLFGIAPLLILVVGEGAKKKGETN